MENTNTTDNVNLNPGQLASDERIAGADVPRNYRVSRCVTCEGGRFAVAWKGSARPACPVCGGSMTTTTRHLKAGFVILEGDVLAQAERLAGGLLADVSFNLEDAGRTVANLVRDLERVAKGEAELEASQPSQWSAGGVRIKAGYSSSGRIVAILEAATKAEAKAGKYERRLAKIGGAIESPAVTKALEVIEARRQRLADERVKVLELMLGARELVDDTKDGGEEIAAELLEAIRGLDAGKAEAIEAGEAEAYPRCPICGDPIDYCQGHGELNALEGDELEEELARREVERRGLPPVAGGSNELDDLAVAPEERAAAADLVVLATLDHERGRLGHDYGAGQRGAELMRRERELGGAWLEVDERTVRGIGHAGASYRPTDRELAAAARRLLAPRLRRIEREDYREATPSTRRTREALEATLAHFAPAPVAGGSNELDEEIVALRGEVAQAARKERADATRIGAEARRTGAFIAERAAASCVERAETLEEWLDFAGKRAGAGDVRLAVLGLRGALGDKAARRAAQTYPDDAALEAAEALSAAQDYTDGGGPVDEAGRRLFDD